MPRTRQWLGLALALVTGILAAVIDTQPRFDDTGMLAFGLLGGSAIAALAAGRAGPALLAALTLASGLPVPVAELAAGGSAASLVALAFAGAGVIVGTGIGRLATPPPTEGSTG